MIAEARSNIVHDNLLLTS